MTPPRAVRWAPGSAPLLLAEVVGTAATVAATPSRSAKVEALADLLSRLGPHEIVPVVGYLIASPRQGRLGVGWRTMTGMQVSHASAPTLVIADVDEAFTTLADTVGRGSTASRATVLADLAGRATTDEWDFLARVVIGELRTGALEGVLLDAIARASARDGALVRRAAMLSGDLGETARVALAEPPHALGAIDLRVGRPVMPMLAATGASVADALAITGAASVEYKLDGARIQVHRRGDDVHVYTRSLAEVTHRVPEVVAVARTLGADQVILDGETLALDEDGTPRPFQDTMARFGADAARHTALRPWFFDILHVDGRDLLDEPLAVRQAELERVAAAWRVPAITTADSAEAERFAARALEAGHEGVMIKGVAEPYAAGRRGKTWIKVKPVHTLDLVVLAVEEGSGRRSGWLSNLHLGAWDPEGEYGAPGGFVMVGKTFKGLTDDLLRWQSAYFPTIQTRRAGHTLQVEPVTVVEIAIDGVQRSTRYPGGVALRFARVKGYRPDKRPSDADTIARVRDMLRG